MTNNFLKSLFSLVNQQKQVIQNDSNHEAVSNPLELEHIFDSIYWDSDWYMHNQPGIKGESLFLNEDYLVDPGPCFSSFEYYLMYPEVRTKNIRPFVHYELIGKFKGKHTSIADIKTIQFPQNAKDVHFENFKRENSEHKIVSVFASFSEKSTINDYVIFHLKELKEVSDFIVFVSDNPILEEELEKIKPYCNIIICNHHKSFDFGCYKIGWQYILENNILQEDDNLLFINDSCFGPIQPWEKIIQDFNNRTNIDFYGLSINHFQNLKYIPRSFYIFKPQVYNSAGFKNFINSIHKTITIENSIYDYEYKFTEFLTNLGFKYQTYIENIKENNDLKFPLIEITSMLNTDEETFNNIIETIKHTNSELHKIIITQIYKEIIKSKEAILHNQVKTVNRYTLRDEYKRAEEKVKAKLEKGEKINVIFLVNDRIMFPAESIMQKMLEDNAFNVRLYVIPDKRFGLDEMERMYKETYNSLKNKYSFTELSVEIDNKNIVEFHNIIEDSNADIVCYPSPYDVSFSLYNPYYAAKNNILSFHINYGFFRSKYDRHIYGLDNYNNFWKVFLETNMNLEEYIKYGRCKACNAVVIGYSKMDALAKYQENQQKNSRKKILISPHHSIDGGYNDNLALSNFARYADLFLQLPKKYPEIDFIFRPHPVLFKVLKYRNFWGEEKVEEYIKKLTSYPNVTYSLDDNYMDIFAQSDGIIQDCGSFLVEYFYTKKPCCYMLKSPDDIYNKFSQLGKDCLEQCYIAYNENEIINFIENIIRNGNDPKKEAREKFAQEKIMVNFPNVSDKILEDIKSSIMETR